MSKRNQKLVSSVHGQTRRTVITPIFNLFNKKKVYIDVLLF